VKRTAASLAEHYAVLLACPHGRGDYRNDRFDIHRVELHGFGRMTRLLSFWWSMIALALKSRPDVVYAHDFFLPLPGWIAARLIGAKVVYDAHELIVPAPGEKLSPRSWFFYRMERLTIQRFDVVVAANPERAEVMRKHYRLPRSPVSVGNVPPLPVSTLSDAQVLELYPALQRRDAADVRLVYMGDMSLERGLGVLVDSCALLAARFKLILVGGGPDLDRLRELASHALAGRLTVIGPVPHAHVHDVIRLADIGYVSYSMSGLNNILCAPNKVFEYAHAGLPMVATCQPTIQRLFDQYQIGQLVGCGAQLAAPMVAAAIQALADDLPRYRKALPIFIAQNTWHAEAARLVEALRGLVANDGKVVAERA
jgi:glycosyltransferase involved in cell wall biosynthesis